MAMQRIQVGTNDDGTPQFHYNNPGGHVFISGPDVSGKVTLDDGTEYDVTHDVIEVASHEHGKELLSKISPTPVDESSTAAPAAVESGE